jgi:hypothetical protein
MKLVLVGGPQRSGTTLVQTLLANGLEAPVLPEAHILCDLATAYKRAKEFWHKTRVVYPTAESLLAFFARFAHQYVDDVAKLSNCGFLVLKDPNFAHVYPELRQLFPQATFIACVRDPRDIAASFIDIGQRQPIGGVPDMYQMRDIRAISHKISAAYSSLSRTPPEVNVHYVAYEHLVRAPEKTIQDLADEAGLQISLEKLADPAWLAAEMRHDPVWTTCIEGGQPLPDRVGAFEKVLRPMEIRVVERICSQVFDALGYARVYPPYSEPKWVTLARSPFQWLIRRAKLLYS